MRSGQLAAAFLCIVLCSAKLTYAARQTLTVHGQANLFGAGHAVPPAPGGGGGGILPPSYAFPSAPDLVLRFGSVTGEVTCDEVNFPFNGPDGGPYASGDTDILSWDGISGIIHSGATMFLSGVFLDDSEPADPAPERLDFSDGTDFTELYLELRQTFFIGDGLTGTGTGEVQQFHVPAGATRLFLGFADAWAFGDPVGLPGWYDDNGGSLSASFEIVPEPATLALLIAGGLLARMRIRP